MWRKISVIGGAFLLVVGLVTSGFVIEDRYNNQEHHDKDIGVERNITTLTFDNLENKIVMNLDQMRKEQKVSLKAQKRESDYRYYYGLLESINAQLYKIKQWIRQNPGDQDARNDYAQLQKKRDQVKQKLDSLMGN